jgi:6-phosphogluconolactonase
MRHSSDTGELERLEVYPDAERLAHAAAEHFVALAGEAIAGQGRFAVALAGGSTPKAAYTLLAGDDFAARVDWARVHVFWGDERPVPPDHPDSNYRMAREALLDHVPLPAKNVHRMRGELEPAQAAAGYEQALRVFFALPSKNQGAEPPARFDLILLGMGDDGHTASLFPGTAAIREQTRWVMAHFVEVINAAANVTFVVSGSGKAERLQQVLTGQHQPEMLPAQIVDPGRGRLRWLVDEAAAASLEGR